MERGTKRLLYLCAGTACLGLGIAGVFLPLLPTTPFVLLASACFARSSERFNRALLASRFGPVIRAWQRERSLPRSAKRQAYVLVPIVLGVSIVLVETTVLRLMLGALMVALIAFLYRLPVASGRTGGADRGDD